MHSITSTYTRGYEISPPTYDTNPDNSFTEPRIYPRAALPDLKALSALPRDVQYRFLWDRVGNTPLHPVAELGWQRVSQKLELMEPSGSAYDHVILPTIEQLESEGLIQRGDELRDITSGSAGTSLALWGKCLGYSVRVTVPDELPDSRIKPMIDFGAEVMRCGPGYIQAAHDFQKQEMIDLIRQGWKRQKSKDLGMRAVIFVKQDEHGVEKRIAYINHSENDIGPRSFRRIGHEMITQFGIIRPPAAIALAMGTFMTIAGVSEAVRKTWPKTRIVGYEGENRQVHDNYGTSVDGIILRFKNLSDLDERMVVPDSARDEMKERINPHRPAEYRVGHSSLMGLVVADLLAKELHGPVICIAYDGGERY